jgi:hypothetical protein
MASATYSASRPTTVERVRGIGVARTPGAEDGAMGMDEE